MNVCEPYLKVLYVSFDSLVDNNHKDYKEPEEDTYLLDIKERFSKFLKYNYWEGYKVGRYEIIQIEISNGGCSGYENSLGYLIGFHFLDNVEEFKELITHFKV